jgi:predicted RNA-binding protein YlxR (DUF448 family)
MLKKIPMRRCLGCFESKPKKELNRVVKTKEGEILLDKTGKKNGRGAYICNNIECLEKAIKSKRLEKEFETNISEDIYETLRSDINSDK